MVITEILQEADFRKRIKGFSTCERGEVFILFGEEDYTKKADVSAARQAVCPDRGLSFFNDLHIDGTDYSSDALLDAVMPMPMSASMKIVTVSGLFLSKLKSDEVTQFISVVSQISAYDYNIVIISIPDGGIDYGILPTPQAPKTTPKPSSLLTKLGDCATLVYFPRNTLSQLSAWVQKHLAADKVSAEASVCRELVGYCGSDMFKLVNEISKLSAYVLADNRNVLTLDDIKNVAIRGAEYGAFDFSNALMSGNSDTALNILSDMRSKKTDAIQIFGEVTRIFCDALSVKLLSEANLSKSEISAAMKWSDYRTGIVLQQVSAVPLERLQMIAAACGEADTALKSYGKDYEPLEQLLCVIR